MASFFLNFNYMTATESSNGSNVVAIVAVVILVGLAIIFFVYARPWLQNTSMTPQPQQPSATIDIKGPLTPQPSQPTTDQKGY